MFVMGTRPACSIQPARMLFLGLLAVCASGAFAQEAPPSAEQAARLTADDVRQRLDQVQNSTTLDDAAKAPLLEQYTAALDKLKREQEFSDKAAQYDKWTQSVADREKVIDDALGKPRKEPKAEEAKGLSLVETMQRVSELKAARDAAQKIQKDKAEEPAMRTKRRQDIPQQLFDLIKPAQEAQADWDRPRSESESDEQYTARRTGARARIQAVDAERGACEKELAWYDASVSLLFLEQDKAERELSECQAFYEVWSDALRAKREEDASRTNDEALKAYELATQQNVPWIRDEAKALANETADLAKRLSGENGLGARIDEVDRETKRLEELQSKLEKSFRDISEKMDAAGGNVGVGVLLRTQRRELPDSGDISTGISIRNDLIASASYDKMLLEKKRRELNDIEALVRQLIARLSATQTAATGRQGDVAQRAVRTLFGNLYTQKREALVTLVQTYDTYINKLAALQAPAQELARTAQAFSSYIDERVLWVKSANALNFSDPLGIPRSAAWLARPLAWEECGASLLNDIRASLSLYLLAASGALLVFAGYLRLPKRLAAAGELASKRHCQTFLPTFHATVITLVLGSGPALLAAFIGWRLGLTASGTEEVSFPRALGDALLRSSVPLLIIGWTGYILRSRGLAALHFEWPTGLLRGIRRRIYAGALLEMLLLFPVTLLEWSSDEKMLEALGRPLFIAAMAVMAWLGHSLLREPNGPVPRLLAALSEERQVRLARIWHWGAFGVPLALMLLASGGYLYTAIRLCWRFHGTLLLLLVLLLLRGLASRALLVVRRRMAREQAKLRREQRVAEEEGEDIEEKELVDLEVVDTQTQGAVRSMFSFAVILGLWFVWADVVPALGVLNEVTLWNAGETTVQTAGNSDGTSAGKAETASAAQTAPAQAVPGPKAEKGPEIKTRSEVKEGDITLGRLLLTLLVAALTMMIVRNLPGLLEVIVLRRLSLAAGERYAINAIVTYTVSAIGIVIGFSMLGIGWSKIQWLIAAMGVGLGFGLQEIFANFVSGIIMLFERPIRVGDTVTIGGAHGTVTRIRIRATRILDWDNKELIVPNKEFIMGHLINWTLSNPSVRLVIPIGIAYGSDTAKALRIMNDIVSRHPEILSDPEPQVLFIGFGDSALNFEIRVHCADLAEMAHCRHQMLLELDAALRESGIEIPFPQRDLHIRALPEGIGLGSGER